MLGVTKFLIVSLKMPSVSKLLMHNGTNKRQKSFFLSKTELERKLKEKQRTNQCTILLEVISTDIRKSEYIFKSTITVFNK